jgi:hypothetical protein
MHNHDVSDTLICDVVDERHSLVAFELENAFFVVINCIDQSINLLVWQALSKLKLILGIFELKKLEATISTFNTCYKDEAIRII